VQPVYGPPPEQPTTLHRSMTFELNLGLGWIHISADEVSDTSDLGLGGLSIGVGGWLNEKLAITGRIAGVTLSENDSQLSNVFFGPSLQYWVDNHFWLGGGLGLAILAASGDNSEDSIRGFGLDLRVGYTFNEGSENTFNASFELNPGFFSENGESATLTGIGILLGYQHL
jgi:hypothetical protein